MVDGEGDGSEGCLKWKVGVIKGSFQKHLYRGWATSQSGHAQYEIVICTASL